MKVEYKVRPVTRYVVTEFNQYENGKESKVVGEFDNFGMANKVCSAVAYDTYNTSEKSKLEVYYCLYSPDYQLEDISVLVDGKFDTKIQSNLSDEEYSDFAESIKKVVNDNLSEVRIKYLSK